jgi:hypothetical protein
MSENYLGNPNLKRANITVDFTQEQIEEWVKCAKDPLYFIEKYVKIVNVDLGFIPFAPYAFQKDIITQVNNNRFVICKMPRQSGKTTTIAALLLHSVLFNEEYNIAILAHKLAQAREILSRIQRAYEALPKWMQQGVVEWNKGNIELENGSKILSSATSSSAIRGGSFNLIYLDEFAFIPANLQDEFFASVYPTISSGKTTKVLITSTPNGLNMFYKLWTDSEKGRNTYKRVDVHWSDIPGRDAKWRDEQIANTSEDQFRVEFECEFVGSSNTLIPGSKLRSLTYEKPKYVSDGTSIYDEPHSDRAYAMVVDTSRGTGADYSAFVIFDISELPYKVVCKYRNKEISPLLYPRVVVGAAKKYNDAYILVEVNDVGAQVADIIHGEFEYENILSVAQMGRAGQQIGTGFGKNVAFGVKTSKYVKRMGCSTLKDLVISDQLIVQDFDIVSELNTFVAKSQSYEAESGSHDDLVMCLVLFSWMTTQKYFRELTDMDFRRKLEDYNREMIDEELTPFGFIEDGINRETTYKDSSGQVWSTDTELKWGNDW